MGNQQQGLSAMMPASRCFSCASPVLSMALVVYPAAEPADPAIGPGRGHVLTLTPDNWQPRPPAVQPRMQPRQFMYARQLGCTHYQVIFHIAGTTDQVVPGAGTVDVLRHVADVVPHIADISCRASIPSSNRLPAAG